MQTTLSIVIPAFNSADTIINLLNSIFVQDCDFLKEVVIVNDGSEDDIKNSRTIHKINTANNCIYFFTFYKFLNKYIISGS